MTSLSTKVYLRDHYYAIASEAKQSMPSLRGRRPWQSMTSRTHGSPRRCAPRDDAMLRPEPSVGDTKPSLRLHGANPSLRLHGANPSLRGRRPWQSMTSRTHGSPRRCAPRDDAMLRPEPSVGDTKPSLRLHGANPSLRLHGANPSLRGRGPWQSMTSRTHGSPRRCAPRDDAMLRPEPSVGDTKPSLRLHGANPSLRGRRPWQSMTSRTHGSPRRCAPRDDAVARGLLVALSFQGHAPGAFRFATGAAHAV